MHPFQVLRRPLITEKSTLLQEDCKYAFEIASGANKHQVKEAVEKAFKVNVTSVNIINVPGKAKRIGRRFVKASPWKKAVVTVSEGQKIEFFEGV